MLIQFVIVLHTFSEPCKVVTLSVIVPLRSSVLKSRLNLIRNRSKEVSPTYRSTAIDSVNAGKRSFEVEGKYAEVKFEPTSVRFGIYRNFPLSRGINAERRRRISEPWLVKNPPPKKTPESVSRYRTRLHKGKVVSRRRQTVPVSFVIGPGRNCSAASAAILPATLPIPNRPPYAFSELGDKS